MRTQKINILGNIDWLLVIMYFLLVIFGWMNIYATSMSIDHNEVFDFTTKYGKQIIWIGLSFFIALILLALDSRFYEKFAAYIYISCILLLILLFVIGKNVNGAKAWFMIGSFGIQPTEFAKTGTILAIARLLNERNFSFKPLINKIKTFTIIFIPALLITLQPDPGSTLVYFSLIFVFHREGLNANFLIAAIVFISLFILTLIYNYLNIIYINIGLTILFLIYLAKYKKMAFRFDWPKVILISFVLNIYTYSVHFIFNNIFKQHHRDRFNILLGKSDDTKDIGYNTYQSIKTITSGGTWGKGFLDGDRTQGNFVPEQHTDYIFSTVGEEWGFIGTTMVVIVFLLFILRIVLLAEKQKNKFGRIYGYGVASIFFFHVLINTAMVIGLFPTIGIPLPFFSYGGSSLWGFTLLLFIFIKLDAARDYEL